MDFIFKELKDGGCPWHLHDKIAIAAEEVFINIADYAYNPDVGSAIIRIKVDKDVIIEFEDTGKPFNPLEAADPDLSAGAASRDIGGLGIYMVKKIMDSAEYRHEDGKNILVIRKTF